MGWDDVCLLILIGLLVKSIDVETKESCQKCSEQGGGCPEPDFCWHYENGNLTTRPVGGTIELPYGAKCLRPCWSSSIFYWCTDKPGKYSAIGEYRCTKNSSGKYSWEFWGLLRVTKECDACSCCSWKTCKPGPFVYYEP